MPILCLRHSHKFSAPAGNQTAITRILLAGNIGRDYLPDSDAAAICNDAPPVRANLLA